jgi:hypothetical protein
VRGVQLWTLNDATFATCPGFGCMGSSSVTSPAASLRAT